MPMPRRKGPKTLLTPKVADRIVQEIRNGQFLAVAAALAGVAPNTVSGWLAKGEKGDEQYREFYERFLQAEAEAEGEIHAVMRERAKIDPKYALAYAGRRWAQRWGRHDNLTVNSGDEERGDADAAKDALLSRLTGLIERIQAQGPETPPPEPGAPPEGSQGPAEGSEGGAS